MEREQRDKRERDRKAELEARRAKLHMQRDLFTERILPAIFITLGLLTLLLIIIAGAILLGILR